MSIPRTTAMLVTATALLLAAAGGAVADHAPDKTDHCAYEIGSLSGHLEYTTQDPTGLTADGYINQGGCLWEFTATAKEPPSSSLEGQVPVDGEYSAVQVAIVDDVFGTDVGASLCLDFDNDRICGSTEQGEPFLRFCGTSPVVEPGVDTDGNGHVDLGSNLMVVLHGTHHQAMHCDPTANPYGGTTGGIVNPAGGLYLKLDG